MKYLILFSFLLTGCFPLKMSSPHQELIIGVGGCDSYGWCSVTTMNGSTRAHYPVPGEESKVYYCNGKLQPSDVSDIRFCD